MSTKGRDAVNKRPGLLYHSSKVKKYGRQSYQNSSFMAVSEKSDFDTIACSVFYAHPGPSVAGSP
jgi:hypothetical protein